ncbi:MAG: malate synthase A [Deltaproteobacteria bacterium]|nr:malate synthase A [Deltaproteobacteria bacterium]
MPALPTGVEIKAPLKPTFAEILTPAALTFIAKLQRTFGARRNELLARRQKIQQQLDHGWRPDFLKETAEIRKDTWKIAACPADLQDRRVEITGPVDRKMVINALNSGSKVFMADFEDANSPTWDNCVSGQVNVRDAIRRTISFESPEGKKYTLNEKTAVLMVRPRGWHLPEKHVLIDSTPMSGSLFDFGLCFFHNAKTLIRNGTGPYFYLPKLENHLEARLWNDVFNLAQDELGIPRGTIKATVLIETILAACEMDEILYELRDHSAGLNCGRWDYIFSVIKKLRNDPQAVMPDRAQVTMEQHFLKSYVDLLIQTCHRRGAHAMGGMAAFIPIKNDAAANDAAIAKVVADKEREVKAGHDGTWVAHPGLIPVAMKVFNDHMPTPHQLGRRRDEVHVTSADLLTIPKGTITEAGLRTNINVGIRYLEAWLRGSGCVPLYNLMEDAATAEISRSQVWQWTRHGVKLSDKRTVTPDLVRTVTREEITKMRTDVGEEKFSKGKYTIASELFDQMMTAPACADFLTTTAYDYLEEAP